MLARVDSGIISMTFERRRPRTRTGSLDGVGIGAAPDSEDSGDSTDERCTARAISCGSILGVSGTFSGIGKWSAKPFALCILKIDIRSEGILPRGVAGK